MKKRNKMNHAATTLFRRTLALAAAAGAGASAHADRNAIPGGAGPSPWLTALLLPSAVGTSNRANCAVDIGVDYTHPDLYVGGSIAWDFDGDGDVDGADFLTGQRASFWRMTAAGIEGPTFLPQPAGGGIVNAVTVNAGAGNDLLTFVGGVFVDAAERPAVWTLASDGSVRFAILPADTNGGEALGVALGDVNGDGAAEIVACGHTVDAAGNRTAAAWISAGRETWHELVLPHIAGDGAESTANAVMSYELKDVLISGVIDRPASGPTAALWSITDSSADVRIVGDLPPGATSMARTATVDNNETITIAGSRTEANGVTRPAVWVDVDRTAGFESEFLPTGLNPSGRVNSIIAILIGLVAAGETTGVNGSSAVVWIMAEWGHSLIDLNTVTRRPAGWRLTSANCLLPYMEQDNLYRIVGNAADRNGHTRGFIAGR